ncbi:hypothetical protein KQI63_15650 [bacterium]|nr:hypothetical protein [bacterium]
MGLRDKIVKHGSFRYTPIGNGFMCVVAGVETAEVAPYEYGWLFNQLTTLHAEDGWKEVATPSSRSLLKLPVKDLRRLSMMGLKIKRYVNERVPA